ncbi:MAG: hypothetical protein E7252_07185 [Lachnospira sp.]|nr:hypothetical protein [Lachnospira sp.]
MDESKIIFQVTKIGIAVNSKWQVFLDGKYVGNVDFKNQLQIITTPGKHEVQYKVGLNSTKVLEVNLGNEDVIVECVWDGSVKNFHVVGSEDNSSSETVPIHDNETGSKASKKWIIGIIAAVLIFAAIGGLNEGSNEGSVGNTNTKTTEIINAAEKVVKSQVANELDVIPKLSSEIIAQGDEWAIVLSRYTAETVLIDGTPWVDDGTYIVEVYVDDYFINNGANMLKSTDYEYELSDSELEVIKAQWGLD